MKEPSISIVMPVYNGEEYLQATLDSLFEQTFKNFELICVDDGSTDSSLEILHANALQDDRMRVISLPHQGAALVRNVALTQVRGRYVAILDSDDLYLPDFLDRCYFSAECSQADLVVVRACQFISGTSDYIQIPWSVNDKFFPNKPAFSPKEIQGNPFFAVVGWTWDKLYRTEYIKRLGLLFQNLPVYNDLSFGFTAFLTAKTIYFENKILVKHRVHNKSISSGQTSKYFYITDALKQLNENLDKLNLYTYYKEEFISYSLHMLVFSHQRCSKEVKKQLEIEIEKLYKKYKTLFDKAKDPVISNDVQYVLILTRPFVFKFFYLFRSALASIHSKGLKYTLLRVFQLLRK